MRAKALEAFPHALTVDRGEENDGLCPGLPTAAPKASRARIYDVTGKGSSAASAVAYETKFSAGAPRGTGPRRLVDGIFR